MLFAAFVSVARWQLPAGLCYDGTDQERLQNVGAMHWRKCKMFSGFACRHILALSRMCVSSPCVARTVLPCSSLWNVDEMRLREVLSSYEMMTERSRARVQSRLSMSNRSTSWSLHCGILVSVWWSACWQWNAKGPVWGEKQLWCHISKKMSLLDIRNAFHGSQIKSLF